METTIPQETRLARVALEERERNFTPPTLI